MTVLAAGLPELALLPGETGRFPSTEGATVPQIVKRSFETASDVVARPVPRLRQCSGCCQATASRTANKIEVVVQLHAKRLELAAKPLDKARIDGLIGKGLPLKRTARLPIGARSGIPT